MNPLSPLPSLAALLIAVGTTALLMRFFVAPRQEGRFASVDGLRGYLAFLVFIHHASIWYFYSRSGTWVVPPSHLYTHFGQISLALFFMITGFLFFTKLLHAAERPVDWLKLFVSRVTRLAPLYAFVILCLFSVVAIVSSGTPNDSAAALAKGVAKWVFFTINGAPDLNGVKDTRYIVAGVTWSLAYEWFFYVSLPLLALLIRIDVPRRYVFFSVAALVSMLLVWRPETHHLLSFVGGIAAAAVVKSRRLDSFAPTRFASLLIIGCIVVVVWAFPTTRGIAAVPLISIAFTLIACGNSLFGVLTHRISRTLGEMSYSIYLLHGLVLFICFHWIAAPASALPAWAHWAVVVAATPVLIVLSFITFHAIEQPAMQSTERATRWLRTRSARLSDSAAT